MKTELMHFIKKGRLFQSDGALTDRLSGVKVPLIYICGVFTGRKRTLHTSNYMLCISVLMLLLVFCSHLFSCSYVVI